MNRINKIFASGDLIILSPQKHGIVKFCKFYREEVICHWLRAILVSLLLGAIITLVIEVLK